MSEFYKTSGKKALSPKGYERGGLTWSVDTNRGTDLDFVQSPIRNISRYLLRDIIWHPFVPVNYFSIIECELRKLSNCHFCCQVEQTCKFRNLPTFHRAQLDGTEHEDARNYFGYFVFPNRSFEANLLLADDWF